MRKLYASGSAEVLPGKSKRVHDEVSAGNMNKGELRSSAGQISSMQAWGSSGIQRVLSVKKGIGKTKLIGEHHEHRVDAWHELEGGDDRCWCTTPAWSHVAASRDEWPVVPKWL